MKCLKSILVLALIMALAATLFASSVDLNEEETINDEDENEDFDSTPSTEEFSSLRGASRFLAQSPPSKMTCNKYPRVCRAKGSAGPDCCKKKCVDVTTDTQNCGMCGKKCKHSEICCKGSCVNPSNNMKHCGGCNKKCQKGDVCSFGICNYA